MGIEQRKQARFTANHPIQVSTMRATQVETEAGRLVDVSQGGLSFIGARYLPPGAAVRIGLGECALEGQVRHCRMREYSARMEFVTGVEIQRVLEGEQAWKSLMSVVQ